jgi:hypothetical protein
MVFSYNDLEISPTLFLLTFPTKGMYPFTDLSPSSIPFIYYLAHVTNNLSVGNSRELVARKHYQ